MSFVTKRNALISALHKTVGVPVLLASQVQPEAEPPFIVYSVTADYIPDGGLGNYSLGEGATQDDLVEVREEQPTATLSFTACSVNRCYDDKGSQVQVLGADEALELATLAQGLFPAYRERRHSGGRVSSLLMSPTPPAGTPWSLTKWAAGSVSMSGSGTPGPTRRPSANLRNPQSKET